ncbi:MAG: outer membrane lipoprotein carrier protein LolA [Candidatus Korobacteraceae bacterium]
MKKIPAVALLLFAATLAAHAQNLEAVLNSMDKAAADFKTAQTDFVWDQYQKVVDEHDIQKGTMYFRRQGGDVQMAADITSPDKKYVLFSDGKVSVYLPKAAQVTEYNAGKNKADFETFLVLGFGGRGHDLTNSFDVKYAGMEQVQGINAAKLELAPKSQKVSNMFQIITLWIDMARGVSVQQLFNERSGDYRLAKYNNIKLNEKLSNDVFKLKTSGKVTYVKPNS